MDNNQFKLDWKCKLLMVIHISAILGFGAVVLAKDFKIGKLEHQLEQVQVQQATTNFTWFTAMDYVWSGWKLQD